MRISLFLIFLFALPVQAQQSVKLYLHSGSTIIGTTDLKEFPLQTKYGLLKIPLQELASVKIGLHYDSELKEGLKKAILELQSSDYKVRELNQLMLINHDKFSFPLLVPGSDMEANKRMLNIKERILEKKPFSDKYLDYDVIKTDTVEARGTIMLSTMDVFHADFNTIKVKISSIREIQIPGPDQEVFDLPVGSWYKCKITHEKLYITASGTIEFWPSGPGLYLSTPNGLQSVFGRDFNQLKAGSVIGKIGEFGIPFVIGEKLKFDNTAKVPLYLQIVEPGWRDLPEPVGSYHIIIKGE